MRRTTLTGLFLVFGILISNAPAYAQVDFTGIWNFRLHEDQEERAPGYPYGEYYGYPINAAGRMRADTWDASSYGQAEWQCRPHSSVYMWRGVHPARIYKDVDPIAGDTIAIHANFRDLTDRVIYMDGRPHPPEEAAHTWAGFSTGKWEGDMLTIETTHLKEYVINRNGLIASDLARMTEHWSRHGDLMTITQIVYDPVYLTEPFILTTTYFLDVHLEGERPQLCEIEEETDRPKESVPHRMPGEGAADTEVVAKKYNLPVEAVKGGAETTYPEYRKKLKPAGGQ